jgi:hypothetical protein
VNERLLKADDEILNVVVSSEALRYRNDFPPANHRTPQPRHVQPLQDPKIFLGA